MPASSANAVKQLTYSLLAPFYDLTVYLLGRPRRRSIARLDLRPGERVLIVGAGTGLDLPLLPPGVHVTAVDLTPRMLRRLRRRGRDLHMKVDIAVMDASGLALADASFDTAILHLILAVVPEPERCAREVARVLRPGGRTVILDKFVPDDQRAPLFLRFANIFVAPFITSLTRRLGPILAGSGLQVISNEPAGFTGYFRIVLVRKPS